jgi:hypothetical protein
MNFYLFQMMSDRLFHYGAHKVLQIQAKFSPTYCYFFRMVTHTVMPFHKGVVPHKKSKKKSKKSKKGKGKRDIPEISDKFLGIAHGDDVSLHFFFKFYFVKYEIFQVFLIYYNPDTRSPEYPSYTPEEKIVSKQLIGMYHSYSSKDEPKYGKLSIDQLTDEVKCLEIFSPDNVTMVTKDEEFGHITFWDELGIPDE